MSKRTSNACVFCMLSVKEKSIEAMRKAGFVISHSVPKGYIIPGQGSVISLKKTSSVDDLILKKDMSMLTALKTKRGVFPSTLIGAMSRLREVYQNTVLYKKNLNAYQVNPTGMKRPSYMDEYEAMLPVVEQKKPVFFIGDKPKNIHRAITLQQELGFDMILSDVKLISPIMNIVEPDMPILLSLDLPQEIKGDDQKDQKEEGGQENKEDLKPTDKEKERLEKRKKESYDLYMSQAKMLANGNVPINKSWNHVAFVVETGTDNVKLYLNGVLELTQTTSRDLLGT